METKAFYQTSEWWLTLASNLAALVTILADVLPARYGIPMMMGVNAFYALSRGMAKAGVPPGG